MYTLKMIIQGDTHVREEETVSLSEFGGKGFKEALALVEDSKNQHCEVDGEEHISTPVAGVDAITMHKGTGPTEITSVELTMNYEHLDNNGLPMQMVLCAAREGDRDLGSAIGVVMTEVEHGGRYEFIYPGDQVYVVNRDGKTVLSMR